MAIKWCTTVAYRPWVLERIRHPAWSWRTSRVVSPWISVMEPFLISPDPLGVSLPDPRGNFGGRRDRRVCLPRSISEIAHRELAQSGPPFANERTFPL